MSKDPLEIAFREKEAVVDKLDEIISLLHAQGNDFWSSAEEFICGSGKNTICYLENTYSGFDLNGDITGDLGGRSEVSFEEWYTLVKGLLTGETVPAITLENAAFSTQKTTSEQFQALLDIAKRHGNNFWRNAADFMRYMNGENHVAYYAERSALDGYDDGLQLGQVLVSYDEFFELFKANYDGVDSPVTDEAPKRNPRPRYRQRKRQKPAVVKTIVRVLYTTQQVYTFKNVRSVQIIDDKVYIQYERDIAEGIKENSESEINGDLVMAVVIHEVGNRSNFFRNIDNTWDYQNEDGTVINSGKQLGRIFKNKG